jgi:hypothetical protein
MRIDLKPRRVKATRLGEQGLLGLAFHPQSSTNGRFFVNDTRQPDGATQIAEYQVSRDPTVAARGERGALLIPQPTDVHNGGMVEFGPDGFLYVGMGDGSAIPALKGVYLFGDLCTGEVFVLAGREPAVLLTAGPGFFISSFGEDQAGEVYVVGLQGPVYRLVPFP